MVNKFLRIEIDLIGEGETSDAPQTVAALLKNRILQVFEEHPTYRQFLDTDLTITIVSEEVLLGD